jgi:two-component system, OmpR family, phosphate regulon response regulator PhoB
LHWMIAEDEADIRNLVATMATVWGHTNVAFESGTKAWEFLESVDNGTNTKPLPEFALMDIRMPGPHGTEVAKRIRSVEKLKHIPIVLMTAFALNEDEIRKMKEETGVDHVINKPLPDFMALKGILDGIIEKKKQDVAAAKTVTKADAPKPDAEKK